VIRFLKYILIFLILSPLFSLADEGLWIPSNIPDSIFKQMQLSGFKLLKSDIYNSDSTSLIDAVPMFGKGCSSGVISADGLIITNFHCARFFIQSHSSITNNLLESGFVANNFSEELTNPNLTIEFTHKIIDVTNQVLSGTTENATITERDSITKKNILILEKAYSDSFHLKAKIEPIFFGNNYLLYIREEFKDIRLVYSPPESIADFGGNKDNWMWPRHSADFAIFRIYSDSLNKPKEIAKTNIPYHPAKYLKFSTKEKKENDFTMILGYPGTTEEYLPTAALQNYRDSILPIKIFARKKRMEIMKQYMDSSKSTHLNYNSKYASTSNYYLKWLSDQKQLSNTNQTFLTKNTNFVDSTIEPQLNKAYSRLSSTQKITSFYFEGLMSMDVIRFANKMKGLIDKSNNIPAAKILPQIRNFYKTFTPEIDHDFYNHLINDIHSIPINKNVIEIISEKKTKNALSQYEKAEMKLYEKSILLDSVKLIKLIKKQPNTWINIIRHDYIYMVSEKVFKSFTIAEIESNNQKSIIDSLQRLNIKKLNSEKKILYSDANSTLRLSFGQIKSYELADAVIVDYKTTMQGIKEKIETEDSCYKINKKFIPIISPNIQTCMISTCHTTGGNSGSPIINGNGEFIGLNFDRNIEGTINDFVYKGENARNIWVDSAYILYLLKEYSKSTHILNSLKIVN
jgi:hypothetical protein